MDFRAANNSLQIDLERYSGLEIQLQVEKQKVEEMNSVIKMKNEQLRQVLDEYDSVQHQLEIDVGWPKNDGPPSGTDYIAHLKYKNSDNHQIIPDLSQTDVLMIQNDAICCVLMIF